MLYITEILCITLRVVLYGHRKLNILPNIHSQKIKNSFLESVSYHYVLSLLNFLDNALAKGSM